MDNFWANAEVISAYTRAQAIEDGVLVDVTKTAKEAGIKFPVAVTQKLWSEYIMPDPRATWQSIDGRLWDVLCLFAIYARRVEAPVFIYKVRMVMKRALQRDIRIKATIHGGDSGEPVITLMLSDED